MILNFLYCFDANYNLQARNSIISLLDKSLKEVSIFIVHQNPTSFEEIKKEIAEHRNLHKIEVYEFQSELIESFPRVLNTHISEATYYRLFMERYIPSDVDYITYLDADIICSKAPQELLYAEIEKLKLSDFIISVKTEGIIEDELADINIRLESKTGKYFNAGVQIIDYGRWKSQDISRRLLDELYRIKEKIYFWDQDVLNSFFDGEYVELSKFLNYNLHLTAEDYKDNTPKEDIDKMVFIHYAGSHKPWSVRGIFNPKSKYYQNQHMKLNNNNYHIVNTWRLAALYRFITGILTLRIIFIKRPFRFTYNVIKSFINND